ncbi:hypothetical protein SDJN02_18090, partial [Cucurbita argyrosperma subsp. argyrosperma]
MSVMLGLSSPSKFTHCTAVYATVSTASTSFISAALTLLSTTFQTSPPPIRATANSATVTTPSPPPSLNTAFFPLPQFHLIARLCIPLRSSLLLSCCQRRNCLLQQQAPLEKMTDRRKDLCSALDDLMQLSSLIYRTKWCKLRLKPQLLQLSETPRRARFWPFLVKILDSLAIALQMGALPGRICKYFQTHHRETLNLDRRRRAARILNTRARDYHPQWKNSRSSPMQGLSIHELNWEEPPIGLRRCFPCILKRRPTPSTHRHETLRLLSSPLTDS